MPQKDAAPLPAMTTYTRIIFQKLFDLHSMIRNPVRTSVLTGHVCKNNRRVREVLVWLELHATPSARESVGAGCRP